MSDQKFDLALAFLQSQSEAAARILEQQPIEYVAEFLSSVPHTLAATVIAKMLPQYPARLCKIFDPAVSAGLLADMEISLVASIMRYTGKEKSKQLLGLLPDKTRIACRLLLNYSEEAVGAWMTANISIIPDDCNTEEALDRIRSEQKIFDSGTTYVVDRERHLKGVLKLSTLIRSAPNTSVAIAMNKNCESIPARTALVSAQKNPAWAQTDNLPVTNRNQQLVGELRYLDLRKGLEQISTTIAQPDGADPITGIGEVYGSSLLALFNTVADIAHAKTLPRS
jgi:Mg/Co/Ni transporter MgtE